MISEERVVEVKREEGSREKKPVQDRRSDPDSKEQSDGLRADRRKERAARKERRIGSPRRMNREAAVVSVMIKMIPGCGL